MLNGVALDGEHNELLTKKFAKLKKTITEDGNFNNENKGMRPIVLRNHNIEDKNPPFNHLNSVFFEQLNKIISMTNYKQISSGLNYYVFAQKNDYDENSSPLLMALGIILINYAEYLNSIDKKGIIVFEEETKKHDTIKLNYIKKVLFCGNKTYKSDYFKNIKAVYFRKKWTNEDGINLVTTAGLELADLTICPLRRILHPEFQIIERKLYNYPNYIDKGFTTIN